ncbi:hypothetical protein CGCA056_v011694 [Colletotrichum aenigma]|uniref:uncharacterized protein n=1 Tax=Colletotrichum aenigma TaxID=1215731 RepID=UPI00187297D5|nr:uncharacterized protein CGCA056_v011694 [Colletotrichum aenigma]KAF5512258.1 hypothetical protein CGCA056_v011694 [Colletotrichum aenigma]
MAQFQWDQVLGLTLMVCGIIQFPRICFCLAMSWLSWKTVVVWYAVLGIYPFLENIAGPLTRALLLDQWKTG